MSLLKSQRTSLPYPVFPVVPLSLSPSPAASSYVAPEESGRGEMPALGFSPNSLPRFTPPSVGASSRKPETNHKVRLFPSERKLLTAAAFKCKAASSSSFVADYDLYDLFGVDSSSDQSQIKNAYRALQKHCHPDIAGPSGHDMAIILNEAYAVLSDPNSRSAYDHERATTAEFRDYAGKPLYSSWFGRESERRAVFVDEVRCVGCLKCALFARNTFAIESVYGRARVVGQWADPEHKILDAIQTCPVDCISIVARSDLAVLEYLMSKQPRGHVRMTGDAGGVAGASNIFADANRFQRRYREMKDRASTKDFKESQIQREARASAMQGIRSISNWWYRQSHAAGGTRRNLVRFTGKPTQTPNTERLREVAAKRRARETSHPADRKLPGCRYTDEYWTPDLLLPSPSKISPTEPVTSRPAAREMKAPAGEATTLAPPTSEIELRGNPVIMRIPEVVAALAAAAVGLDGGQEASSGLKEHVGGAFALGIVNSFWLQVLLAATTWYLIGAAMVGLAAALGSKRFRR